MAIDATLRTRSTTDFHEKVSESRWRDLTSNPPGAYIGHWCDDESAYASFFVGHRPRVYSTSLTDRRYFALSNTTRAASLAERLAQELWGALPLDALSTGPFLDLDQWLTIWPLSRRALPAMSHDVLSPSAARSPAPIASEARKATNEFFDVGWSHRGMLKGLINKSADDAISALSRLAVGETVSAPLTLALALEAGLAREVAPKTRDDRLILVEVERIIAHLRCSEKLAYNAGYELLATHFKLTKKICEDACRTYCGSEQILDSITLGGLSHAVDTKSLALAILESVQSRLETLRRLSSSAARAFSDRATISRERADIWLLNGINGRASGRRQDLRAARFDPRYFASASEGSTSGDARARMQRRLQEINDSLLYLDAIMSDYGAPLSAYPAVSGRQGEAICGVEGARGESWCWVRCAQERITHIHFQTGSLNMLPVILQSAAAGEEPSFLRASFDYSAASAEL